MPSMCCCTNVSALSLRYSAMLLFRSLVAFYDYHCLNILIKISDVRSHLEKREYYIKTVYSPLNIFIFVKRFLYFLIHEKCSLIVSIKYNSFVFIFQTSMPYLSTCCYITPLLHIIHLTLFER